LSTHIRLLPGLFAVAAAAMMVANQAGAGEVKVVPRSQPTCLFGDHGVRFAYEVTGSEAFEGRFAWRISAASRTVASGEKRISLKANQSQLLEFDCTLPAVKEGVVFPLQMQVSLATDRDTQVTELEIPLHLFADNPFADRQVWLESLQIHVFDPMGETAAALTELKVPFEELAHREMIASVEKGVVIVGEGIDWDERSELGGDLLAAAERGAFVICLAPTAGDLPLPFDVTSRPAAASLTFRRSDVIQELDKRLSLGQGAEGPGEIRGLKIVADSANVRGTAVEPGKGWPWVEARFAETGGRLTWCGFGLVRSWKTSPTPRYLLARLFERASPPGEATNDTQPSQDREIDR
jgi:hypothetical protein